MMHITVVVFGTWGDLRPNVVLAQALRDAGHHVQVLASGEFEDWIRVRDLDYAPIQVNIQAMLDEVTSALNPLAAMKAMRETVAPAMIQFASDTLAATQDSDMMLVHESGTSVLSGVVEANKLIEINVNLQPLTRTHQSPSAAAPHLPAWMPFQSAYNEMTFSLTQRIQWSMLGAKGNEFRTKHLNLPQMNWRQYQQALKTIPTLTAVSEHLFARPSDWGDNQHVTGFLFDDDPEWHPPQALLDFLDAGENPIYIGFGSMSDKKPEETTRIVVEAMRQTGKRAVILSGWAGIGKSDLPDTIHVLNYASHSWLFPKMAAVVHHGGAGTTAAGIRAGVPSIIVPHMADQSYWGNLLYQQGVATKNIPRSKFSLERLVAAINEATSSSVIQDKAATLGEKIRAEDSIGKAMRVIEGAIVQTNSSNLR